MPDPAPCADEQKDVKAAKDKVKQLERARNRANRHMSRAARKGGQGRAAAALCKGDPACLMLAQATIDEADDELAEAQDDLNNAEMDLMDAENDMGDARDALIECCAQWEQDHPNG